MKFRFLALLFFVILLAGCEDGDPIVKRSQAYPSPDSIYAATLEEVDNGLGFGQGALYEEVHITRRGESVGAHGNPGRSVVFYVESTYKVGSGVKVSWLDSRHLRVEYSRDLHPGRALSNWDGVAIEFLTMEPK